MTTTLITLRDSRQLAYADYGDPLGQPIIYFHGCPSSRLEAAFWHERAAANGYRLVAPDRPGCGRSDPQPGRTVLDVVDDVQQLADHLGWARFGVIGMSVGMPSVAACAYRIPDRFDFAVDCAGWVHLAEVGNYARTMAPGDRLFAALALRAPFLLWPPFRLIRFVISNCGAAGFRRFFKSWASPADQREMADEAFVASVMALTHESFFQGTWGPVQDAILCFRDWGFRLSDITMPVHIFQGEDDRMVAPAFSRYAAQTIPQATLKTYPNTGHYGLLRHRIDDVFTCIKGQSQ
jgi:pimeloyl-ACP methyl ester carboxylesterase